MVRTSVEGASSESSDTAVALSSNVKARSTNEFTTISALSSSVQGDFIVCGDDHGRIVLHDLITGNRITQLYKQKEGVETFTRSIHSIEWNETAGIMSTLDLSAHLQIVKLVKNANMGWEKSTTLLNECLYELPVRQQLFSPDATRLIVATSRWTFLYDLVEKRWVTKVGARAQRCLWIKHPLDPRLVLLFEQLSIRTFTWESLEQHFPMISIEGHDGYDVDYEHYATCSQTGKLFMRLVSSRPAQSSPAPRTYRISSLDLSHCEEGATLHFSHCFVDPSHLDIELIIGTTSDKVHNSSILLFLTKSGTICSIDLNKPVPQRAYTRHFFVPSNWLSGTDSKILKVTGKREVLVVQKDELAVFKNALDHQQVVDLS